MAILNWTTEISVGIDSIDVQHKKLFDYINNFYDNLKKGSNSENLAELLSAMMDYTVYHFSKEEKLMQQYGYLFFSLHKSEHSKFIDTVNTYQERLKAGKLIVSVEITNFLKNWITSHILISDKKYSEFLISKGVQ